MEKRKNGDSEARFPWKTTRFRDVPYSNLGAKIVGDRIRLPHGKAGYLFVPLPKGLTLPSGRLMEATLTFGELRLVFSDEPSLTLAEKRAKRNSGAVAAKGPPPPPTVGIDLGVNTLLAATDGVQTVLVSGREVKATVQWRAKKLASLSAAQAKKTKGSRRSKRLQKRKHRVREKTQRRINDLLHKATRKVADAFPKADAVVGKPFNAAAQKMRRTQAQQVASASTAKAIRLLSYKLQSVREVNEAYSSQTCPGCGCRQRCRRSYRCGSCGWEAPRDVVGAVNILQIGQGGGMVPRPSLRVPSARFVHPSKYPSPKLGSSGGTPAGSSASASSPRSPAL